MLTKENKQKETKEKVVPFIPEGDFYFTKGVEAFQKRKFDIALKWLKKAVDASPNEAVYHCQTSIIYTEIGAYHTANQILTEVVSKHGEDYIDCYYLIANNYAHLGLFKDAKKYILSYLDKNPEGDFVEEAQDLLALLDEVDDDDEDWVLEQEDELLVYQETIFHHMERKEWELALPLIEEMMELFPEFLSAKHEHSFVLFFSGQRQDAIELELKWLEKDPQSLYSHTNLAIFYYEQNELEKCTEHIQALKNVYPIHEQQKLRIANTLSWTGRYEEAYQRFKTLSKSQLKGHASYFKWFSQAAFQTGNTEKAFMIWKEGCKQHSTLSEEVYPWLQE